MNDLFQNLIPNSVKLCVHMCMCLCIHQMVQAHVSNSHTTQTYTYITYIKVSKSYTVCDGQRIKYSFIIKIQGQRWEELKKVKLKTRQGVGLENTLVLKMFLVFLIYGKTLLIMVIKFPFHFVSFFTGSFCFPLYLKTFPLRPLTS